MINNKKGFTLIELLIVLGISAIIISVVSMFFINNARNYTRIDTDTELSYQAQFISNFVIDEMLKATGIVKVISIDNTIITQSNGSNSIRKIAISNNKSGASFELKNGNEIFYGNNSIGFTNEELGKYITQIDMISVPETKSYAKAKCIKLIFYFKKDKQTYGIEQTVFFRNAN